MSACINQARASMSSTRTRISFRPSYTHLWIKSLVFPFSGSWLRRKSPSSMPYSCNVAAVFGSGDESSDNSVEGILSKEYGITGLMKMERRSVPDNCRGRWFPYLDLCRAGSMSLASWEVIEALEPCIMNARKEKILRAVENRSYSVSLVVEGLMDFGNVSAAFRSADALGIQSVHVVSGGNRKRYRENRHVSMGAEKWLDIELWNSPIECFQALRRRDYRIATANLGMNTVSIYDLDWSHPTAIVVGNEHFGISHEALQLSDLNCSIPMKGMVDSFNVSVAAGILMHHAVSDRISRLGRHGDLTSEERQILLAEFFLRHRECAISIVQEYAKRKLESVA